MKQFKKLMVFMLAALMVFGTIKYTPIYAEDAVAKEEGVFDTVTFEGKKDITIHAGKPFTFTQKIKKENEINTGEEEIIPETEKASQEKKKPIVTVKATREGDSAKYRAIVSEVKTPEGGNFVYHEGDTTFMPAEAEVGKEYVITYQAETSIDDGKTWQEVPDAKYEVHVKIAEKEEQPTESEEQLTSEESEDEHNQENLQITADDIVFHGENEKTISIGANYNFYDMNNIYASGPSDHHELYAITVEEVETPEGGSYVYQNGDQQFTPTKDDSNLDYTITYGVSVSTDDGKTWHKVDNAEFVTKLHIAKEETTRSARRRRSVPIYAGMISKLTLDLENEYYTGQLASGKVNVIINGTGTVDEPFLLELSFPKSGVFGPNDPEEKYRLRASDFNQSLGTTVTEDANNYYVSYKLATGSNTLIYTIPFSWKFIRTGLVPDGETYTIKASIKTLSGNTVKDVSGLTTLRLGPRPNVMNFTNDTYNSWYKNYPVGDDMLDSSGTKLKTDLNVIPRFYFCPKIFEPQVLRDLQNDTMGIRQISKIVDTYTLPDVAVVSSTLPAGYTYNPTNHTVTHIIENTINWSAGGISDYDMRNGKSPDPNDVLGVWFPNAVLNQIYNVKLKREYIFNNTPSENFTLSTELPVKFYKPPYVPSYGFIEVRKQFGKVEVAANGKSVTVDNLVGWNSNPYVDEYFFKYVSTINPNPTDEIAPKPLDGVVIENQKISNNMSYNSVIFNPNADARPTSVSGTFRVIGIRADGGTVTIANSISYQSGNRVEVPINEEFASIRVIPNNDATIKAVLFREFNNNASGGRFPEEGDVQGCRIRFTFKFKDNLDPNNPYVFIGRLNSTFPYISARNEVYDYGRRYYRESALFNNEIYSNSVYNDYNVHTGERHKEYNYAFYYRPNVGYRNEIVLSYSTVDGNEGGYTYHDHVGDRRNIAVGFKLEKAANNANLRDGIVKVTIPVGYEIVNGNEYVGFGSHGTFEMTRDTFLNSRTGPFTDTDGSSYYLYRFGNASGVSTGDVLLQLFIPLKRIAYNPEIPNGDARRFARVSLTFAEESGTYLIEKTTPQIAAANPFSDFAIHRFSTVYSWIYNTIKIVNVKSDYVVESEKVNSTYVPAGSTAYRWVFDDPPNIFNTTSKRVVPSVYDYLNDVIDVEIAITSLSDRTQLYTASKLDINIPAGYEIVSGSESLTDNNGNFSSDKTLSEIVASRNGNIYDFGKISITEKKNLDLTLKFKVKVTEDSSPGTIYFTPNLSLVNTVGKTEVSIEKTKQDQNRMFNYIPSTGLYSSLTGYGITAPSYSSYAKRITYEYKLGNFTGLDVDGFTIIDYLPSVDDLNMNGSPRGTEITPIFENVASIGSLPVDVYYSSDTPQPGMTAAEYDSIANWSTWLPYTETKKAVKIVSRDGYKMNAGFIGDVARLNMLIPNKDINSDDADKIINNSFFIKYKTKDSSGNYVGTNFVESNTKKYVIRTLKINTQVFVDENNNGVYDEDDQLLHGEYTAQIRNNNGGGNSSFSTTGYHYNSATSQYDSPGRNTYYTAIEGEYWLSFEHILDAYTPYNLCPYGVGENHSNIHPDTKVSEKFNLSLDGTREVNITIGLQLKPNYYKIRYDLNGGHDRNTGETFFDYVAKVGDNHQIQDEKIPKFLNPYHIPTGKWNTEPDGTGTSYTEREIVNGGLSTTGGKTITLYAQWNKVDNYIVEYNRSGPNSVITGTMANDTVTVGSAYTVKNNAFVHPNAEFAGWNSKQDGTGVSYYEGQITSTLWDGDPWERSYWGGLQLRTTPVIYRLYAQWKQDLYTFKATDQDTSWGGAISNPAHPVPTSYDAIDHHPYNYVAKYPVAGVKFRITKINTDGSEGDTVSTATSQSLGELYFKNMIPGEYYLIEENTPTQFFAPEGKWKIRVGVDEFTGDLAIKEGNKTDAGMLDLADYDFYMKSINKYILNEVIYYHKLGISVQVGDENAEFASINQNFRYKITFLDRNFKPYKNKTFSYVGEVLPGVANAHPAPSNGTITTDEHGVAYVTLKHGQRIQIQDTIGGSKISVYQVTEGADVYTQVNGSGFAYTPDRVAALTVEGKNGNDGLIDFKVMNFVPVPTGIHHMNNKSILLGVGVIVFLMLVAYSVYIRKRRYHRMNLSEDRDIYESRMVPKGVKVDAYQEDQTEIKPPVGGPSPGIRNPHHRSRDSTDLQLPIWMVSDTG